VKKKGRERGEKGEKGEKKERGRRERKSQGARERERFRFPAHQLPPCEIISFILFFFHLGDGEKNWFVSAAEMAREWKWGFKKKPKPSAENR